MRLPLITSWPVLTEASYLLRRAPSGPARLIDLCNSGAIVIAELPPEFLRWAVDFYARYDDRRPDFADAATEFLFETLRAKAVFTLDRRDFGIYRVRRKPIPLLPSPA